MNSVSNKKAVPLPVRSEMNNKGGNTNGNNGKLGSQGSLRDQRPSSQTKRSGSQTSIKTTERSGSKTSINGERPASKTGSNGDRAASKTSLNGERAASKTSLQGERPSSKTSLQGERPSSKTSLQGERPSSRVNENGEKATSKVDDIAGNKTPPLTDEKPSSDGDLNQGEKQQPPVEQEQQAQPKQQAEQDKQAENDKQQSDQPPMQENDGVAVAAAAEQISQAPSVSEADKKSTPPAPPPEEPVQEPAGPEEKRSPLEIRVDAVCEKKISKKIDEKGDDVLDSGRELVEILHLLDEWANPIALKALKKISRLYFDHASQREKVSAMFVEKQFPALLMRMYQSFNKLGVFSSDDVWYPTYYVLNNLWNYTDSSQKLGVAVAQEGFIKLLHANITHQPYLDNQTSKNVRYVLKASLSILQNVVHCDGVRQFYTDDNVVQALKPFLAEDDVMLKTLSIMCLSVLVTEEENASMEDSGTIPFIVKNIRLALNNAKGRSSGFTSIELAETLGRIAVNDDNKKKIVEAGALEHLVVMLKAKDDKKQYAAARLLWTLSFDAQVKQQIIEQPECVDALTACSESENSGVKKQANGVLWKLKEDENKKTEEEVSEDMKKEEGHIMISYNWDNKEMVLAVKERLQAEGHKVWVDIEQMGGSTLEAMALAIENAKCVLVCLSEKYKLSPNCRTEAEYTFQLKKPIVPMMMQRYYKPDGWLGMLCGSKLYVNFDGKYEFDYAYGILGRELASILQPAPGRDEPDKGAGMVVPQKVSMTSQPMDHAPAARPAPAPAPQAQFRKWSLEQVLEWSSKLTGSASLLEGMDGEKLYQLCQMRSQAPEFFYNYLCNKEGMKLMDILHLTQTMEELK